MTSDIAIKSKRVLTPQGIQEATVIIRGEKILEVLPGIDTNFNGIIEDVGESIVMPGIIDCHVHINEPGRTDWEGFETATKAAAAGGITTLIEMPLNSSPVTTSAKNFEIKLKAAKGKTHVNCGFWGGVVPGNTKDLEELLRRGVFGLKAFLTHSGIEDFPNTGEEQLYKVLLLLKKYDMPLLVHCELDSPHNERILIDNNPASYDAYLKSRPKSWENNAVKMMIKLCRQTRARVHIVHLSSAEALSQIETARSEGLPLTVETCPHYLFFDAEMILDGATTFKCAPPIREKENNEALWQGLKKEIIDFIVTDHSPAPPEMKEMESGDFKKAWGGIAGLQFSLPVVWTKARKQGFRLEDISKLMSVNVAKFMQLESGKGKIQKGCDADLVVWNPEKKFSVEISSIQHRHKITPYINQELWGVVEKTYINGNKVFEKGEFLNLNKGKIMLKRK